MVRGDGPVYDFLFYSRNGRVRVSFVRMRAVRLFDTARRVFGEVGQLDNSYICLFASCVVARDNIPYFRYNLFKL